MSAIPNPLADRVRAKYPGVYDDLSDDQLTQKVLAKYPQYQDLAQGAAPKPPNVNVEPSDASALRENGMGTDPKMGAMMNPESLSPTAATAAGSVAAAGPAVIAGTEAAPIVRGFLAKQMAQHPILGPTILSYAISKAREIPGVGKLIPSGAEIIPWLAGHGAEQAGDAGAPLPETPPQELRDASSLYRGPQPGSSPSDALGTLPVRRGQLAEQAGNAGAPPQPIQRGSMRQMMNDLQDQVGQGLGASPPPNPKAPIYQRGNLASDMGKQGSDLFQGHTPVDSSALSSFKYDPATREFEVKTPSGSGYAYGDVSPEEAQAFQDADSKGKAWQAIRSNPLVRKTVNGKWQSVKPATTAQ